MSQSDHYFQFPLCALSYSKTVEERLRVISGYSIVDAGLKRWQKAHPTVQERQIEAWRNSQKVRSRFLRHNPLHCAARYGLELLEVTTQDIFDLIARYNRLVAHTKTFHQTHGRDVLVRIRLDWLFKARDGKGLTYREFAVLCAIYSCIGNKQFAQVTQPRIRRCALGYRTAAIMDAEIESRADEASPLTQRQLRDTIERLHRNRFFARCTFARRITYYSIRLDDESLRKRVFERQTYAGSHRAKHASKDVAMTKRIRSAKAKKLSIRRPDPAAKPSLIAQ